ncbi:LacI family DNA-binding transcriptional regulator [Lentzea flava]|uniref:LacI family transcriptional regulator n=1 Tax=Lentzea flava TaxID=103732 RepID=A0ABQ2UUJ1_9PSEU|nr:LacI family DNA-binding transcriptional regulator [Lentzea flava]MCP2202064.1 transcriptional regulator, LacI family [Lentzea flava]GGU54651.1 LacI family transcriptional regulator [Lentzea flava]
MVTIADVAQHAGVAPSTVSYVLTGKRPISAGTKSKVRASISSLGYEPPVAARTADGTRANVIGVVLPLRTGTYLPPVTRFVTGAATTARRYGVDLLLMTAEDGMPALRRVASSAHVDGFLVMDADMDDGRLRQLPAPSVLIGRPSATTGLTCVDLDFEAAGAQCVDHLADLGHRSIGFLGAPSSVYRRSTGFAHRAMAGFNAAAMRRGVAATAVSVEDDRGAVLRAIETLVRATPSTTALVVHNEAALGGITACLRAVGREVPEDIAVVAICADEVAERMSPPLTSVRLPAEELGRHAVELLVAELDGRRPPPLVLLPPSLSRRASTPDRQGSTPGG